MKSKIIIMADRIADKDDKLFQELFADAPIANDGFSERVTSRLRRRLWLRRICLSFAVVVGASIAFRPLVDLVSLLYRTLLSPSSGLLSVPVDWIPTAHMTIAGALLFGLLMFGLKILED